MTKIVYQYALKVVSYLVSVSFEREFPTPPRSTRPAGTDSQTPPVTSVLWRKNELTRGPSSSTRVHRCRWAGEKQVYLIRQVLRHPVRLHNPRFRAPRTGEMMMTSLAFGSPLSVTTGYTKSRISSEKEHKADLQLSCPVPVAGPERLSVC